MHTSPTLASQYSSPPLPPPPDTSFERNRNCNGLLEACQQTRLMSYIHTYIQTYIHTDIQVLHGGTDVFHIAPSATEPASAPCRRPRCVHYGSTHKCSTRYSALATRNSQLAVILRRARCTLRQRQFVLYMSCKGNSKKKKKRSTKDVLFTGDVRSLGQIFGGPYI